MDTNDRRHSPRQERRVSIQVSLISDLASGQKENCQPVPARIVNQSAGGLYIWIDRALMAGANVSIVMLSPAGYQPGEACTMYDGLVLRCENLHDAAFRFGIGIKILRKLVCAPIRSRRFG